MSVTVPTKDMGDIKDKKCENGIFKISLEDLNEKYIKEELKIK